MMQEKVIGVDLGTKTIGLAISDSLGFVFPINTFRFEKGNYKAAKDYLATLATEKGVKTIVIGYPLHLSGQSSERSISVERFKEEFISEYRQFTVILVDERLSTVQASKFMKSNQMSAKQRQEKIDSAAAVLILETYIKRSNYGKLTN